MIAAALLLSYVIGSIPTGLWLGLGLRGVDIREHGSKNIGATNTMRVLGKGLGAIALLGDAAKGFVSVWFVAQLSDWAYAPLACGIAAILGHTLSVFLRFRGGKGVATSAGVFLALAPLPTLIAIATFAIVVALTRMVSAGSIAAAIAMTIAVFVYSEDIVLRAVTAAVALLILIRHRTNLQRIFSGTENKL